MFIDIDGSLINLDYVVRVSIKTSGETVQVNFLLDDYTTTISEYISIDEWDDYKYEILKGM